MSYSTVAKIERRTSGIRRESKKISSSALKTAPELKKGGKIITLYFTTPRYKYVNKVIKTPFKICEQV